MKVRLSVARLGSGVPEPTLRRWICEGRLPSQLVNGVRYVRLEEVVGVRDTLKTAASLRNLTR